MSSTNSIEDAALDVLVKVQADKVEQRAKKEASRKTDLPLQLVKLLSALNRAKCKDVRQNYGSGEVSGLGELELENTPETGSTEWKIIYRLHYPGAKPDTWRRSITHDELDRLVPPLLRMECNSKLHDGVHCTGTAIAKLRIETTGEGALDLALTVLHSIGIQIVDGDINKEKAGNP